MATLSKLLPVPTSRNRLYAKVVALAGKTKVVVALEAKGKPIRTLALTSVILAVANSTGPASLALTAVTCHPLQSHSPYLKCHQCNKCERLKQEVEILVKALSDMCSLRSGDKKL